MKLPFLSFFNKQEPKEYFLAFLLRDEEVHAVAFEKIGIKLAVVGLGKCALSSPLESVSEEELLNAADKAISIAETNLPENIQTHKTVFGVKETWVEQSHIKKDYLLKLKKLSEELDLQPIGFLVFPEAIAHLLQQEEGAPISGILIDVGLHNVTVTLIRAGRIIQSQQGTLEESLPTTVETLLKQFSEVEIFPSRLILFDNGNKKVESHFISHHWSKNIPFLHVPQVTTLPADFDTRAILFGTATQMGLDIEGLLNQKLPVQSVSAEISQVAPEGVIDEKLVDNTHETSKIHEEEKEKPEVKQENFATYTADTSDFGFVKDEDIAKEADPSLDKPHQKDDTQTFSVKEEVSQPNPLFATIAASGSHIFSQLALRIKSMGNSIKNLMPSSVKNLPIPPLFIVLIPLILLLILLCGFWYVFGVKANVTILVQPKVLQQNQSVTFTTNGASTPNNNVIAADTLSVSEDGNVSADATGTKDIGDKAKGKVTIFNSDTSSHTVSSGTTITSSNGLKFTLDNGVTIASATGDIFSGTTPGTADVSITASDIGTDYNLPSNTKFTISGSSIMAAKNSNAFAGGSKKSITVISQKDLDGLVAQLTKNLESQAKADAQKKVSDDKSILPLFVKTTVDKKDFDKDVNSQASNVTLTGSITYQTLTYKKSDMDSFNKQALEGKLPSDFTLAQSDITYSVSNLSQKNDTITADVTLKASLLPKIDTKELANQVAGKSFSQAKDILSSVPQFSDATFQLSPPLFFLPQALPRIGSHIDVTLHNE